jgi:c-di-GMP-specific phosphodiesterase
MALVRSLDEANVAIMQAAGDLRQVAAAVVSQAVALTGASASSMFQMRGGHWARIAVAGPTDRSIAVPASLWEIPGAPILVRRPADSRHPISRIVQQIGVPSFAAVPLHLWPGGPALVTISALDEGDIGDEDVAVLNQLAIVASTAAYRTPLERSEGSRALDELKWHQAMLQAIARGTPVADSLQRVCVEVEGRYPGAYCSILLADTDQGVLRHIAAPSLPAAFRDAVNGLPIADGSGACGSAAASRSPVVVTDAWADPRTRLFRDVAVAHNLRSVWSYPLLDSKAAVIGTFALYRGAIHSPDPDEVATVATLASVAALAIERYLTEVALTKAAQRDPLTDLPNRAQFEEMLAGALDRARQATSACAVMFLDLDGFKFVNDSLGHQAGDRVLIEVAKRLRAALRGDVTLARFGGDEFTVLVENATPEEAQSYAETITAALSEPVPLDGGQFIVTTAIGIAMSGEGSPDPESVLRDADAAMYAAKAKGRSRQAFFDRTMRQTLVARMTLERELHQAVHDGTIAVHYQPIVDIASGHWCGAEALARWSTPLLGEVPADIFIPLAEEIGVISRLGRHVIAQAIEQMTTLQALGLTVPVSVNVSAVQLADPEVAGQVLNLLSRAGIPPTMVCLEITESVVMADPDLALRLLTDLRDAGVRIVIDDFGTGHSSIARLGALPVAAIKIDKSFTAGLLVDHATVTVVGAMIELAHTFGYKVTAEGVERSDEFRLLADLGCDQAQGYLFARPSPSDEFAQILSRQPALPQRNR